MMTCKRTQSGTVLPICLLFLFLIAQLAMSAVETAALNQTMVVNLRQSSDVNRVSRLALDHAQRQLAAPGIVFPLEVSMEESADGMDADIKAASFRFSYRIDVIGGFLHEWMPEARHEPAHDVLSGPLQELLQESGQQPLSSAWEGRCVHRHRLESVVYGFSDTVLRRDRIEHYLCCADVAGCEAPSLSVWLSSL